MDNTAAAVLSFWFGDIDQNGMSAPQQQALWFKKSAETDSAIREQFGPLYDKALADALQHWALEEQALIALIVVLDQFSRNLHRDSALAFSGDEKALALALGAIASGMHKQMPAIHRVFLYLPLEHSEQLDLQNQCVVLFEELARENARDGAFEDFLRYAIAHRDVIRQFGRFPHRNAILGRVSTPEEQDYLKTHSGF